MDSTKEATASQPQLFLALDSAQPWAAALHKALDGPSRRAVHRTSKRCRLFVVEDAEHTDVVLLAYDGLTYADWRCRLTQAEVALAIRGQGRSTTLVLRQPAIHPAALEAVLSLSPYAGRAATELHIHGGDMDSPELHGVHTPFLQGIPATFPNLKCLRLARVCGTLPAPASLPHLKALTVYPHPLVARASQAQGSPCSVTDLWASVAAYTAQLTELVVLGHQGYAAWPELFTKTTTTLTHFKIDAALDDEFLTLLHTHVPNLAHLTCEWRGALVNRSHADKVWGVREIGLWGGSIHAADLAALPKAASTVRISSNRAGAMMKLSFDLAGPRGLPDTVVQRMKQWHIAAPCHVRLDVLNNVQPADLRVSIGAALQQLSSMPAGTTVQLDSALHVTTFQVAAAAVAAAAPALPHLTIRPPKLLGVNSNVAMLCRAEHGVAHASIQHPRLTSETQVASLPWAWKSLYVGGEMAVQQLLYLPDPTRGQYDIEAKRVAFAIAKMTSEQLNELEYRLPHYTFVVSRTCSITIEAPQRMSVSKQPAALRQMLQLLALFRWRREPGSEEQAVTVQLLHWTLTSAVVAELRALPSLPFSAAITFDDCSWLCSHYYDYEQLPPLIPTCFREWRLCGVKGTDKHQYTAEHLVALCRGVCTRSEWGEKLTLIPDYHPGQLSAADRSVVERCFDEGKMGCWMEKIEWTCYE